MAFHNSFTLFFVVEVKLCPFRLFIHVRVYAFEKFDFVFSYLLRGIESPSFRKLAKVLLTMPKICKLGNV